MPKAKTVTQKQASAYKRATKRPIPNTAPPTFMPEAAPVKGTVELDPVYGRAPLGAALTVLLGGVTTVAEAVGVTVMTEV